MDFFSENAYNILNVIQPAYFYDYSSYIQINNSLNVLPTYSLQNICVCLSNITEKAHTISVPEYIACGSRSKKYTFQIIRTRLKKEKQF